MPYNRRLFAVSAVAVCVILGASVAPAWGTGSTTSSDTQTANQLLVNPNDLSPGWSTGPGFKNPNGFTAIANCEGIPAANRVLTADVAALLTNSNGDAIFSNASIVQTDAMAKTDHKIMISKKAFACDGKEIEPALAAAGETIVSRQKLSRSFFGPKVRPYFGQAGTLLSRNRNGVLIRSVTLLLQKGRAEISIVQESSHATSVSSGPVSLTADFKRAIANVVQRLKKAKV
jgi:hypothetical protein